MIFKKILNKPKNVDFFDKKVSKTEFLPKIVKVLKPTKVTPTCSCNKEMAFIEQNINDLYYCNYCGENIVVQKEFFQSDENNHLETIRAKTTSLLLSKTLLKDNTKINEILDKYMLVRDEINHRKEGYQGDVAACYCFVTGEKKKNVAFSFGIEQSFVSSGLNILSRIINDFKIFDYKKVCFIEIEKILESLFKITNIFEASYFDKENMLFIISEPANFNVGCTIPCKTRAASAVYFYIKSKNLNISDKEFIKATNMQKETFTKYFKELLLVLKTIGRIDGKFNEKLKKRKELLLKSFEERNIIIPKLNSSLKICSDWKEKYILEDF